MVVSSTAANRGLSDAEGISCLASPGAFDVVGRVVFLSWFSTPLTVQLAGTFEVAICTWGCLLVTWESS